MTFQRAGTRTTLKMGNNFGAGDERTQEQSVHCFQSFREEAETALHQTRRETHCSRVGSCRKRREREEKGARGDLSLHSAWQKDQEKLPMSGSQILVQPPWEPYSNLCLTPKMKGTRAPEEFVEKPHEKVEGLVRTILTLRQPISGKQMEKSGTRDTSLSMGLHQGLI